MGALGPSEETCTREPYVKIFGHKLDLVGSRELLGLTKLSILVNCSAFSGKSSGEENKSRVDAIHALKEKLKSENDELKKIKYRLKEIAEKQKAEKEVGGAGARGTTCQDSGMCLRVRDWVPII